MPAAGILVHDKNFANSGILEFTILRYERSKTKPLSSAVPIILMRGLAILGLSLPIRDCLLLLAVAKGIGRQSNIKMSSFSKKDRPLVVDPFCIRQFNNPDYTGSQINFSIEEFEERVNQLYAGGLTLVDGYAPFW